MTISIFDAILIGEMAVVVATSMQFAKSHPRIQGSMIPILSGITGMVLTLIWFLVQGLLFSDTALFHVDWVQTYRAIFNGLAGAIAANAGYNLQKFMPQANLLPTSNELDQSKIKEVVEKTEMVQSAVNAGVPKDIAKEVVGLENVPIADPAPIIDAAAVVIIPHEKENING